MDIKLLFEDHDFIGIEKPAGLSTIPERNQKHTYLLEWVRSNHCSSAMTVHRLDKDVSGVVVFAKHVKAHRSLNLLFDQRKVIKSYMAILHGTFLDQEGVIVKPIRQFGSGRMGVDVDRGKPSTTRFALIKANATYSKVQLYPQTGRRHQLRVHMYYTGHPIVGDPLYGDRKVQQNYARLFLHACRLEFEWEGNRLIQIESEVPEEFDSLI